MGFTLLEAMACGTPAICSNVAGMPEYVEDGETGYVFDDLATLTDRLRSLANDPGLVERLGRQARRRVEVDFDFRVAGARMIDVYEPLIARGQGVAA
jgi:glycosyltransferase involved in cell wall biosynthesis